MIVYWICLYTEVHSSFAGCDESEVCITSHVYLGLLLSAEILDTRDPQFYFNHTGSLDQVGKCRFDRRKSRQKARSGPPQL